MTSGGKQAEVSCLLLKEPQVWLVFWTSKFTLVVCKLGGVQCHVVTRVEWVGHTKPMQFQIWTFEKGFNIEKMVPTYMLHGRRTQLRENGIYSTSPLPILLSCPKPTQTSLISITKRCCKPLTVKCCPYNTVVNRVYYGIITTWFEL